MIFYLPIAYLSLDIDLRAEEHGIDIHAQDENGWTLLPRVHTTALNSALLGSWLSKSV